MATRTRFADAQVQTTDEVRILDVRTVAETGLLHEPIEVEYAGSVLWTQTYPYRQEPIDVLVVVLMDLETTSNEICEAFVGGRFSLESAHAYRFLGFCRFFRRQGVHQAE